MRPVIPRLLRRGTNQVETHHGMARPFWLGPVSMPFLHRGQGVPGRLLHFFACMPLARLCCLV